MRRRMPAASRAPVLFVLVAFTACAADEPVVDVAGECADANGADLCTWASTQGGVTLEAGATIPLASIENAPAEVPMAWPPAATAVAALPAAGAPGGFVHKTMYWEPMGHAPATYQVPHFDFHFYLIPDERRRAIDCTDTTKPETLPEGYVLPDEVLPPEVAEMIGVDTLIGICVPEMGMHAVHAAESASAEPFEGTMVIGYYGGEPIFIEPMISQAKLVRRESFELAVPAVAGLEGRQPTAFRAEYVPEEDAYRFTFSGFAAAGAEGGAGGSGATD